MAIMINVVNDDCGNDDCGPKPIRVKKIPIFFFYGNTGNLLSKHL